MIVSIPYQSYYKPQETAKMTGTESNHEANSKEVLGLYCYKTLPINLFLGHVSRLQTEPENSKLIAERKYGEGVEKNSIEDLVLDFGLC